MTLIDNPRAVVEVARRLTSDFRILRGFFPTLDEVGILNLAKLVTEGVPVPPPAPPPPPEPPAPPRPAKQRGLDVRPDKGNPINTYKLAIIDAVGGSRFSVRDLLRHSKMLLPPGGQEEEDYLRRFLDREARSFKRHSAECFQVTPYGQQWARRSNRRINEGAKADRHPKPLPPTLEEALVVCPAVARACYNVLDPAQALTVPQVVSRLKKRGWLPKSKSPARYIGDVLLKNPGAFERVSGRGIDDGPSTYLPRRVPGQRPRAPRPEDKRVAEINAATVEEAPLSPEAREDVATTSRWTPRPGPKRDPKEPRFMDVIAAVMGTHQVHALGIIERLEERKIDLSQFKTPAPYIAAILARQPEVFEPTIDHDSAVMKRYRVIHPETYAHVFPDPV